MKTICPSCEATDGKVGEVCGNEICKKRGYHFIPYESYEKAREYARKKKRLLDQLVGRKIDKYLIIGILGEGGMGAVYLALQTPLNREVALKVISGLEWSAKDVERFEREARAIALLEHSNICKLYDYGIGDLGFQLPYMAMEYVRDGVTLRKALAGIRKENKGEIPKEIIKTIFRQILNALGAAHEKGILHRDMKPDNIMITKEHGNPYVVKILDFGLAKAVSKMEGFDSDITNTSLILGTPAYMAPEQLTSRMYGKIDGRVDLYATAVMLFEIFTGVRPYGGETISEIIEKKKDVSYNPLDIPEARRLSDGLRAFFEKGLAREIEKRYETAEEMLRDFERALGMDGEERLNAVSKDEEDLPILTPIVEVVSSKRILKDRSIQWFLISMITVVCVGVVVVWLSMGGSSGTVGLSGILDQGFIGEVVEVQDEAGREKEREVVAEKEEVGWILDEVAELERKEERGNEDIGDMKNDGGNVVDKSKEKKQEVRKKKQKKGIRIYVPQ